MVPECAHAARVADAEVLATLRWPMPAPRCQPWRGLALAHRAAAQAAPREACGVLLARRPSDRPTGPAITLELVGLRRCRNLRSGPRGFALDPAVFARHAARARRRGLAIAGFWHSHPKGPLRPSDADRATAWPGTVQCIVAPDRPAATWWWAPGPGLDWVPLAGPTPLEGE